MTKKRMMQTTERTLQTAVVRLEGTASVLVAKALPWDVPGYWDSFPPEIREMKRKPKRIGRPMLDLLDAVRSNGFSLELETYDEQYGVDAYQEAVLRGHWLPDAHAVGFPVDGFRGALATGATRYGGKNSGLPATKLRGIMMQGDPADPALAKIDTKQVLFDEAIGFNSGANRAPRHIIRLRYELPWTTELTIQYPIELLTAEKIAQAFTWAGDFGIGQRRPGSPHGGQHGTFRITSIKELR